MVKINDSGETQPPPKDQQPVFEAMDKMLKDIKWDPVSAQQQAAFEKMISAGSKPEREK